MGQTYVGIWQWGSSWFDGNADYITTFQNAYDYGPLGQTQNSSGVYYYGTRGALVMSTVATAAASYVLGAEIAANGGLYSITTHAGERLAERVIPNAAVQWGLQTGTRQAALQSSEGLLANVCNFLTKCRHVASAAHNESNGALVIIRNVWNNNIVTAWFTRAP